MSKGISYIETNGTKEIAVVDLRIHGKIFQEFLARIESGESAAAAAKNTASTVAANTANSNAANTAAANTGTALPTPPAPPLNMIEDESDGAVAVDPALNPVTQNPGRAEMVRLILEKAQSYLGAPYLLGGTDKKGMDCSGLTSTAYAAAGITLPRTAILQSDQGLVVQPLQTKPGDLIFFDTAERGRINHAGIVVSNDSKSILFVHASTSKGVIVSDLAFKFWQKAYRKATRPIPE